MERDKRHDNGRPGKKALHLDTSNVPRVATAPPCISTGYILARAAKRVHLATTAAGIEPDPGARHDGSFSIDDHSLNHVAEHDELSRPHVDPEFRFHDHQALRRPSWRGKRLLRRAHWF
jgi:hypothetical protein